MIIGIHDAEKEYMKNKSFPNYALMKISAYHKAKGDIVKWWYWDKKEPLNGEQIVISGETAKEEYERELTEYNSLFDLIYSSKVFEFTPENKNLPQHTVKGGTGYVDIPKNSKLPQEIDDTFPDYTIYPKCDYAIGYLTRGCPNHCTHCVVPEKEGNIKPYRIWQDIVRKDTNKLILMDNNILACEYGINQLESLIDSGYKIDLNQGMEARLVTPTVADIIAHLKWIKYIRFSCDRIQQIEYIERAAEFLMERGIKPYRLFVYILVTKDIENAEKRVERLKKLKGICIYAQPEQNPTKGIIPNEEQKEFAQRYIYGGLFRKETWAEYCQKRPRSKI